MSSAAAPRPVAKFEGTTDAEAAGGAARRALSTLEFHKKTGGFRGGAQRQRVQRSWFGLMMQRESDL